MSRLVKAAAHHEKKKKSSITFQKGLVVMISECIS